MVNQVSEHCIEKKEKKAEEKMSQELQNTQF